MKTSHSFSTIDTHTGGEPTRTIIGGIPPIPGRSMADKMTYLQIHMDWIRTCLMYEPRGHNVMSGSHIDRALLGRGRFWIDIY
jgi:proline racemase